jgi:hypothetical protein
MLRAVCLAVTLFAVTDVVYADDHLGIHEFRLGMTADKYVAAYHKYHWGPSYEWESDQKKALPFFLLNGSKAYALSANTTDGDISDSGPLPAHTKNLPVWRIFMEFSREDGKALHDILIEKYAADCRQWQSGAEHKTPLDWWCVYETADEKLFLSADDSSVPENIRHSSLMIEMKRPRASLSGL